MAGEVFTVAIAKGKVAVDVLPILTARRFPDIVNPALIQERERLASLDLEGNRLLVDATQCLHHPKDCAHRPPTFGGRDGIVDGIAKNLDVEKRFHCHWIAL